MLLLLLTRVKCKTYTLTRGLGASGGCGPLQVAAVQRHERKAAQRQHDGGATAHLQGHNTKDKERIRMFAGCVRCRTTTEAER
jgi:hypothetical protein